MDNEIKRRIYEFITQGMTIKFKPNIERSLKLYGDNAEKRAFADQTAELYEINQDGRVKIYRDREQVKKYMEDRKYWSFDIEDLDLDFLFPAIKNNTQEKILFDVNKLDI